MLTEAKRALAEQASEAKSRFLATLGHEVRTPMTGVLGMKRTAARQPGSTTGSTAGSMPSIAPVSICCGWSTTRSTWRGSKRGKLELANADFALRPLLDEGGRVDGAGGGTQGALPSSNMSMPMPRRPARRPHRLQQILLNLLGNAIKFTEAGHVALETAALAP